MARSPRYVLPGQPQHIIQRGNNRAAIFAADADYVFYARWLAEASWEHGCSIHAYVLMTNHVHLLITPQAQQSVARTMQDLGRRYARYFNITYRRTGALFEGRYRAIMIDSERYLLTCYRYIELNPVRAGKAMSPCEYRWSSFHANGLGAPDPLVTPHQGYVALGTDHLTRCAAYRELVPVPVAHSTLRDIRGIKPRGRPPEK